MISTLFWSLLCIRLAICLPSQSNPKIQAYLENPSIQKLREYIKIDTSVQENIPQAVEFWKRQANALGLSVTVVTPVSKPIVVITWPGSDATLPSIALNSHMDVVPVEEAQWTYPPFEATIDKQGNIYGRGAQDDKDTSIQYLEAVRRLMEQNVTLPRTVHITLMPDEETGGHEGMMVFPNTTQFKALNVGFVLDEGLPSSDDVIFASYLDKRPWQVKITVRGESGHGSTLAGDSTVYKLEKVMERIHKYRDTQLALMGTRNKTDFGLYTTVNVNVVHGGIATNVIPSSMYLVADARLAVEVEAAEMEELLDYWTEPAGNSTTLEFYRRLDHSVATPVNGSNPYWTAILDAAKQMNKTIQPIVLPATSDMLYVRNHGIYAIGLTPKTNTVMKIHGHDEYVNADMFLDGIDFYVELIKKLGNVKEVK